MPKRGTPLDPSEQRARFEKAARDIADDGGLSPTAAEERFERTLKRVQVVPKTTDQS